MKSHVSAERFVKPLVNERKNSLFFGSDRMANVSAVYHTLMSTCKQMKASASDYFGKLFDKVVRGCTDMASMLPMNIGLSVKNIKFYRIKNMDWSRKYSDPT